MWESQKARVPGAGLQWQEGNRARLCRACGLYRGVGLCPVGNRETWEVLEQGSDKVQCLGLSG